jgi:FG-GAP-like repeat
MKINRLFPALLCAALAAPLLPAAEIIFKKQTFTTEFVAEGCAIADFNRDGHMDVTAGCYIWYGPDFLRRENFTPANENASGLTKTPYNPETGYSDYFLAYAYDFNGDSWPDILVVGLPGEATHVFVNPKGQSGHWSKHLIFDVTDNESPDLIDINGDGKPEFLVQSSNPNKPKTAFGKGGGQLGYAEFDWANPLGKVRFRPITPKSRENDEKYFRYTQGYGAGDVNDDGRVDILDQDGWREQPADTKTDKNWKFHPGPFVPKGWKFQPEPLLPAKPARGGSFMYVYDVNADGRNDVVTGYESHGSGLGWFEQNKDGTFTERRIMGRTPEENAHGVKFTQLHAMRLVDVNGDGLMDIVTGKRWWAHGPLKDEEPNAPAVLYWFELKRDGKGRAEFIPHLIDSDSGVGTQVTTGDINKDGKTDILVANKKGVFVFTQQ